MPENKVPEPLRSPKVVAPDLGTWFGEDMVMLLLVVVVVISLLLLLLLLIDGVVDDLFTMLIG